MTVERKGEMLSRMLILATNQHLGQFDKGGNPYILHPLTVMHYLDTNDEELMCIALGHDLLEDALKNMNGVEVLRLWGMSERVIDGIIALTKVPGEQFEDYKKRITANQDAIKVKIADLRHNIDIRRIKEPKAKDIERVKKYISFYEELKNLKH